MTLYQIYSAVDNEEAYVDLKQDDRKIVEFINYNKGNYTDEAVFIAQSGYTSKNISNTDFIQTIPKMLLFSETFINKLADKLKNELDFFPAKLRIKNDEFKFFLGKIKLTAELVNMEKSNFYEIDGKFYYTKTFSLFNVSPDEVSRILHETFGENIKVSTLSKVNKLVVSAERDILENAISIIEDIDKNPKQVKISSQILDISNNLFEELGFDWVYRQNVESQERNSLTAIILGKAGLNGIGSTVNIVRQFNNKSDVLSTGINLLEATNDLVVSSVPTLMIASGEEGEFKVTEEVIVGVKSHRDDKKDRYSEPVFKEAGLIMKVKPIIKDNDYIILEISLELSDFKFKRNILNLKDINSGTYNSEGGSKVGRGLTTKVRVKNGDTILLGGLKKSIQQNTESKIPILGDIPIISFFFKNTTKKNENCDMYIKLKVEIDE